MTEDEDRSEIVSMWDCPDHDHDCSYNAEDGEETCWDWCGKPLDAHDTERCKECPRRTDA